MDKLWRKRKPPVPLDWESIQKGENIFNAHLSFLSFLKNRLEVFFFPQRNTRELVLFFGLACSAGIFCVFTNQRNRVDSTSRWFSLSGQRGGREEEEDLIFSSPPLPHQSSFSLTPTPLDAFSSLCWNPRWCLLDQNVLTRRNRPAL